MQTHFKLLVRRMFYRSSLFRVLIGVVSVLIGRTNMMGVLHLLSYTDKKAIGPLQRDEALALLGMVKTLCPETIVEFGFYQGHSAFNFLCAMEADAKLYSYDISEEALKCSKQGICF